MPIFRLPDSEVPYAMKDPHGNLIRTLRQRLGMTQEEFTHEVGVMVSTVNR